jgi:hypothetical protein
VIAALVLAALSSTLSAHHAVSTSDPVAQADFDRGLTLLYAYNGPQAAQAFASALQRDPHLAMAAWGEALADGTDLNTGLTPARYARAQTAARLAQSLRSFASPPEQAYIAAVDVRYDASYADHTAAEAKYRDAMTTLVSQYPLDDDAATLDAEALMEHLGTSAMWTNEGTQPVPDAAQALNLITRVLVRDPNHIFANHLCVHAYDYAHDHTPAIACADRLASWTMDPAEEHLAHMPAHTYLEIGQYAKALRASEYAWHLRMQSAQPLRYAAHDAYTGWSASMMLGDLAVAQTWATRTGLQYSGSDLWATWARFGQWQRIALSNAQNEFYAPLSRGWTDIHFGVFNDARAMLALYGNADTDYRWLLQSSIDEHRGSVPDAAADLQHAITYQQSQDQAEQLPLFPAGEYLGYLYYRHRQYAQARDAFQDTLLRYPNDPRALYGLALAQRALGENAGSSQALQSFASVWNAPNPPNVEMP